jgi:hypothetical protein
VHPTFDWSDLAERYSLLPFLLRCVTLAGAAPVAPLAPGAASALAAVVDDDTLLEALGFLAVLVSEGTAEDLAASGLVRSTGGARGDEGTEGSRGRGMGVGQGSWLRALWLPALQDVHGGSKAEARAWAAGPRGDPGHELPEAGGGRMAAPMHALAVVRAVLCPKGC